MDVSERPQLQDPLDILQKQIKGNKHITLINSTSVLYVGHLENNYNLKQNQNMAD